MANWCLNTVTFEASESVNEQIRLLFIEMAEREILTSKGQLPPDYVGDTGYLFEIDWLDSQLCYLTKWSPNIGVIMVVADQYDAGFVYNYEELAMGIYGMAVYHKRILHDIYLEAEDFRQYTYNDNTQTYVFEGEDYDNDWDVLEILLQRKVKRFYNKPN